MSGKKKLGGHGTVHFLGQQKGRDVHPQLSAKNHVYKLKSEREKVVQSLCESCTRISKRVEGSLAANEGIISSLSMESIHTEFRILLRDHAFSLQTSSGSSCNFSRE